MSYSGRRRHSVVVEDLLVKAQRSLENDDSAKALEGLMSALAVSESETGHAALLGSEVAARAQETPKARAARILALLRGDECLVVDKNVLVDAYMDPSSTVCQRCDALIPKARLDNHLEFWCEKA